jgi:hypothetical protein
VARNVVQAAFFDFGFLLCASELQRCLHHHFLQKSVVHDAFPTSISRILLVSLDNRFFGSELSRSFLRFAGSGSTK